MMTPTERAGTIAAINMFWPRDQIAGQTALAWGAALAEFDRVTVANALHRLAKSHKWRPSIAEIVAECKPEAASETALEAFQAVQDAAKLPLSKREGKLSAKAWQAVQRLGGWGYVGGWQVDQTHHNQRLFCEAYGDVSARHEDCARLGIEVPDETRSALRSAVLSRALGGKGGEEAKPLRIDSEATEAGMKTEPKSKLSEAETRKAIDDMTLNFLNKLRGM